MKVDVPKMRKAAKRLAEGRPDRRKSSDLMATVRPLMAVIRQLRDDKVRWAVIAASLAEQGVVEGGGRPLSQRRLTSAFSKLEAQAAKQAARMEARGRRGDLAGVSSAETNAAWVRKGASVRLAPELTNPRRDADERPPISEAEILREQRQKQQHLFKKD